MGPGRFTSLAWNDINTVCPSGACGSGSLNGFDMAGWTWATIEEMNNLFNHCIGFPALGPGPDSYFSYTNRFFGSFKADGWRYTEHIFSGTYGRIADQETNVATMTPSLDFFWKEFSLAETNSAPPFSGHDLIGAFFHRPSAAMPGKATLPLLGLALAVLSMRRKFARTVDHGPRTLIH